MINFDNITTENIKEHNPNWPQIPDLPYRILIIVGGGGGEVGGDPDKEPKILIDFDDMIADLLSNKKP